MSKEPKEIIAIMEKQAKCFYKVCVSAAHQMSGSAECLQEWSREVGEDVLPQWMVSR